jgi:hypothetical protein
MAGFEITGPYAGAMLMSIAALCIFVWGIFSGALTNTDRAAAGFFEREMDNERSAAQRSGKPGPSGPGGA